MKCPNERINKQHFRKLFCSDTEAVRTKKKMFVVFTGDMKNLWMNSFGVRTKKKCSNMSVVCSFVLLNSNEQTVRSFANSINTYPKWSQQSWKNVKWCYSLLLAIVRLCVVITWNGKKFDMKNKWRNNRKKTKTKSNDIFTSAYNTTAIKKFINCIILATPFTRILITPTIIYVKCPWISSCAKIKRIKRKLFDLFQKLVQRDSLWMQYKCENIKMNGWT